MIPRGGGHAEPRSRRAPTGGDTAAAAAAKGRSGREAGVSSYGAVDAALSGPPHMATGKRAWGRLWSREGEERDGKGVENWPISGWRIRHANVMPKTSSLVLLCECIPGLWVCF